MINGDFSINAAITSHSQDAPSQEECKQALLKDCTRLTYNAHFASEKVSQKDKRRKKEWDRVNALCTQVAADIKSGDLVLPKLERNEIWSNFDSGSTMCAADHKESFPGATLKDSSSSGNYYTATCQCVCNDGELAVPSKTENGHDKSVNYLNAGVAMPMTSMHTWNKHGHRTLLDEHGGVTTCIHEDTIDPVQCRHGVYVIKMYVDPGSTGNKGFGRPGNH